MSSELLNKKLDYWEHQLLDLGKRNKMINYRETKRTTIKLVEPSFDELYNRLAINEETLTFQRAIDRETDIRVFSILSLLENLSSPLPVTIGDIKTEGSILERQKTLKNLRSKSRLAQEEQGTNILYLSFGFIEWKDGTGASAKWIKSPLILVPVVLTLEALNSPYTLKKHEDDIVVNPTLEYYLKTEYGIEIPTFDSDKDNINDYLKSLEEIADKRGWRIIKEVSLGLLSFLKISMYNDLVRNEDRIKKNPVIRAMAGDVSEANSIPDSLRNFDLDSISTQDCFQVMSADSSQQDAILYSKNNISFVMQGPPGTGKSQTITNIIAEALADGKKVLFVSEKMAALQVVYRRLQDAHLGEFCLPLHSYKANKKETLEQIGANLKLKQTKVKDSAINDLEDLLSIRRELNKYAAELHELNPQLNISCYEVYSKLEKVSDAPNMVFSLENPLETTQTRLQSYLNALKEYVLSLERLNYEVIGNPWQGLSARIISYEYSELMEKHLKVFVESLGSISRRINDLYDSSDICDRIPYSRTPEFADLITKIAELPRIPTVWVADETATIDKQESILTAQNAKNTYDSLFKLRKEIAKVFNNNIYQYDYLSWNDQLLAKANGLIELPFITGKSAEFFIKSSSLLEQDFEVLKDNLSKANELFIAVNRKLGTDFAMNPNNYRIIISLYELLSMNMVLYKAWFSSEISRISRLVTEAKSVTDEINKIKAFLLNEWEPEILVLDYMPILTRYKTEYTGFFKAFNGNYKCDQKQLRSLSKTVIKKIPDNTAVELLSTLKVYHEKTDWLNGKSAELTAAIGSYYKGTETNWTVVIQALNVCSSIKKLLNGNVPSSLLDLVSGAYSSETAELQLLLSGIAASMANAKKIITEDDLAISINAADFDIDKTIKTTEDYISVLSDFSAYREELKPYLINPDESLEVVFSSIHTLTEYKSTESVLDKSSQEYSELFEFLYCGEKTDWDYIIRLLNQTYELKESDLFRFLTPVINLPEEKRQTLKEISSSIRNDYYVGVTELEWLQQQFTSETNLSNMSVASLFEKTTGCLNNIENIEKWVDYQETKEKCCETGLDDFTAQYEKLYLSADAEKIFLKGFYLMWLEAVCSKSESVRRFRRNVQDERIKKFIELDDLQLLIAQARIREKLIENLPSTHHMLKATDEVAILNKELSKKRNIMPLRKLFKKIPNLLMRLKPCLMMSPLSVSYFLETEAYHFDLVIFDEASQIFPEDAIGAIFRGSQVIIAGDSKQLPPTNFFSATTNNYDGDYDLDEENDFDEVISDSILEETAAVLPNRTLLWHYRSKHENLIAFSNREIYKNSLITFPNSITNLPDMGVEYFYVKDGCYDRGGKKNNIKEAEECVKLVFEHIDKYPERSLGIIAFSESQQSTIENAIVDYREEHPEYEWFFDESREEPFFVKNLENVQGDERDTIIFSICYAKDKNGTMYMNFGPVGHNGGERRLNVAVTRAKCNIKLVGSILPSDIDVNRAKSEGARMLRSYIEYAMKGTSALPPIQRADSFASDDEFCSIIAGFIESHGYTVERQVGCSDYKVDIAVVNPDADGEYIAGIECDGLSYVQAKTARDRDHLRRTVLQNMGWNLYRVWSTEWNRNPNAEGESLLAFLNAVYDGSGEVIHNVKQSNSQNSALSMDAVATESFKTGKKDKDNPYGFSYYEEASWWNASYSSYSDNDTRIAKIILYVLSVEQPMHLESLYKRMGPSFTTGKASEAVKRTIDRVIKNKLKGQVLIDKDRFARLLPLTPPVSRIPRRWDTPRPMDYIHTEEVAAAMIKIIQNSYGVTLDDLASECARVFGFERKGPKIKAKTDAAINYLIKNHKIRTIDGKVQLTGE